MFELILNFAISDLNMKALFCIWVVRLYIEKGNLCVCRICLADTFVKFHSGLWFQVKQKFAPFRSNEMVSSQISSRFVFFFNFCTPHHTGPFFLQKKHKQTKTWQRPKVGSSQHGEKKHKNTTESGPRTR